MGDGEVSHLSVIGTQPTNLPQKSILLQSISLIIREGIQKDMKFFQDFCHQASELPYFLGPLPLHCLHAPCSSKDHQLSQARGGAADKEIKGT